MSSPEVNSAGRKKVHLNFFETACRGNHESPGQWSRPGDNSFSKDSLDYYIWMAKLAEKAKITGIFFADTYAGHAVYGGNMDAILRAGTQVAQLDPLVIISAMAVSAWSSASIMIMNALANEARLSPHHCLSV
jgi:hypothetical protein